MCTKELQFRQVYKSYDQNEAKLHCSTSDFTPTEHIGLQYLICIPWNYIFHLLLH